MRTQELRALLVDDDSVARKIIQQYVKKTEGLELVGECSKPAEALRILQEEPVDILLLDMELPEMSGLDMLRALDHTPHTIFITSSKEYAVDAFDHNAVDFLLKPFDLARFSKAVARARERLTANEPKGENAFLGDAVFVRHNAKYVKIPTDGIIWIEAVGDYANIHTEHRRYTIHCTMKTLETKLPARQFLRVHRSYIVRIDAIQEFEDNALMIGKDKTIPVGKSYRTKLVQTLNLI
jgi:DNA-binding LytR/AlgR family response regulator